MRVVPETLAPAKPDAIEWVDASRAIFEAEDPAKGPYHRFNPATGKWDERPAVTVEFLTAVAANSDPTTGKIRTELGVTDFDPAGVIGHEEVDGALVSTGMPRAARSKALRMDGNRLRWDYQVPKPLAPFLDPKDGALPRVSASFYPDFVAGGKRVGPALRHVAFLGATPPAKRNLLGLWNPDLYLNNAEAQAPNAVRFAEGGSLIVKFAEVTPDQLRDRLTEAAAAKAEAAIAEIIGEVADEAGIDPAPLLAWANGQGDLAALPPAVISALKRALGIPVGMGKPADGTTPAPEAGAQDQGGTAPPKPPDEEMPMAEPVKTTPPPGVSAKDFAETQALLAKQGKTLETLRAENDALKATVAKREREHGEAEILAFAERLADKYPGEERQKAIVAAMRKARGYLDFAEGESKDPAALLFSVLDAVGQSHRTSGVPVGTGAKAAAAAGTLEAEHAEYAEAVEGGLTASFRQYAEAQGHPRADILAYAKTKGIDAEKKPEARHTSPLATPKRK